MLPLYPNFKLTSTFKSIECIHQVIKIKASAILVYSWCTRCNIAIVQNAVILFCLGSGRLDSTAAAKSLQPVDASDLVAYTYY